MPKAAHTSKKNMITFYSHETIHQIAELYKESFSFIGKDPCLKFKDADGNFLHVRIDKKVFLQVYETGKRWQCW